MFKWLNVDEIKIFVISISQFSTSFSDETIFPAQKFQFFSTKILSASKLQHGFHVTRIIPISDLLFSHLSPPLSKNSSQYRNTASPALYSLPLTLFQLILTEIKYSLNEYEYDLSQKYHKLHQQDQSSNSRMDHSLSSGDAAPKHATYTQIYENYKSHNLTKWQRLSNILWVLSYILPGKIFKNLLVNLVRLIKSWKSRVLSSSLIFRLEKILNPKSNRSLTEFPLILHMQEQKRIKLNIKMRPHVNLFLRQVSKWYEIVIFTAAIEDYGNAVCDRLEYHSGVTFSKRFFRQHCDPIGNSRQLKYTKDIAKVSNDLANVFIIDNSEIAFKYYPDNAILIDDYLGEESKNDEKLLNLLPILDCLRFTSDVRNILTRRKSGKVKEKVRR